MRPIDADEFKKHIAKFEICCTNKAKKRGAEDLLRILPQIIDDEPTIGVAPRKTAHWIRADDNKCRCSECDIIAFIAVYPHGDKKYCPNCGSKMEGVIWKTY